MILHTTTIGAGEVRPTTSGYALRLPATSPSTYDDAQISSYTSREDLMLTTPIRFSLRARAEGELVGTAGFGFWNHPFVPGERGVRLPKAAWFFYGAPPNNMALARGVPGYGWKCATIDAANWRFLALLPTAPLGFLLMRVPMVYRALWPIAQQSLNVSEHLIAQHIPQDWHDYALEWRQDGVTFWIDDAVVYESPLAPRGKLGFIAWVDNQYAVVTPQGQFKFGVVDVSSAHGLIVEHIHF